METRGTRDVRIDADLIAGPANHTPLSPLSWLGRAAQIYPDRPAVIYGARSYDWRTLDARARRLASGLIGRGIAPGDTVAILAPNIPEMVEAHFGVPLAGAILNTLNTRLDAESLAFMLSHGEAKALIVDPELAEVADRALSLMTTPRPLVIDIVDPEAPPNRTIGALTYDALLDAGDPAFAGVPVEDEWDAISLNYTSGTTGDPKGVVYHHRGAFLSAMGNLMAWGMTGHPVYLWTLPMFHCNGWCFPWALAALAGTHVCLRRITAETIVDAIEAHGVTHFCGAPTIMTLLIQAGRAPRTEGRRLEMMTAAAPPPAAVIEAMERLGVHVTHVYGLTECYGPATICAPQEAWTQQDAATRARLNARQGVAYPTLEGLKVVDVETGVTVPADGESLGEILLRGNMVMKGYLKNPATTAKTFADGWLHTGDLGVLHPDGYVELKDRAKDIIISGGENISTVEVESVLFRHPAVLEAAVVARPDSFWGETPCAFVTLKPDGVASEAEIIAFCRDHLAHFKTPRTVVFGALPKTSTGKVQKFALREQAKALPTA
jgi:fatty-acyl-CoA synthase